MSRSLELVNNAYIIAALDNNLQLAEVISTKTHNGEAIPCPQKVLNIAAYNGNLSFLKWICNTRPEFDVGSKKYIGVSYSAMKNAAKNGHLDVVEWLHFNRPEFDTTSDLYVGYTAMESVMDKAFDCKNLELVKWLSEHRSECFSIHSLPKLISENNIKGVKLFMQLYKYIDSEFERIICSIVNNCLNSNRFEIFEWVVHTYPTSTVLAKWATSVELNPFSKIVFVDNKVYEWLVENVPDYGTFILTKAICSNNFQGVKTFMREMYKYIHRESEKVFSCIVNACLSFNRFDIFKFVVDTYPSIAQKVFKKWATSADLNPHLNKEFRNKVYDWLAENIPEIKFHKDDELDFLENLYKQYARDLTNSAMLIYD